MSEVALAVVLHATAIVNLFTKQEATIAGTIFSGVFFLVFTFSERYTHRQQQGLLKEHTRDRYRAKPVPGT